MSFDALFGRFFLVRQGFWHGFILWIHWPNDVPNVQTNRWQNRWPTSKKLFIQPKMEVSSSKNETYHSSQNDPVDVQCSCVFLPAEDTSFTSYHLSSPHFVAFFEKNEGKLRWLFLRFSQLSSKRMLAKRFLFWVKMKRLKKFEVKWKKLDENNEIIWKVNGAAWKVLKTFRHFLNLANFWLLLAKNN